VDKGDRVELTVGASTDVVLPGLGTAGYTWSPSNDSPAVVGVEARPPQDAAQPGVVGESREERFRITALSAGTANVTFRLARSFEPQTPARDVRSFSFTVR
jgi:predicted secreted protein